MTVVRAGWHSSGGRSAALRGNTLFSESDCSDPDPAFTEEASMEPSFQGAGRPRKVDSDERSRSFVRLVMDGGSLVDAARRSRVSPAKALRLLDDPVLLQVVVVTRRGAAAAA